MDTQLHMNDDIGFVRSLYLHVRSPLLPPVAASLAQLPPLRRAARCPLHPPPLPIPPLLPVPTLLPILPLLPILLFLPIPPLLPIPHQAAAAGAGAAAPGGGEGAAGGSPAGAGLAERVVAFQRAFWKFLRPHTIRGTVLGTSAVVARALLESPQAIDWGLMPRALRGLLALLCGNGYIVGINQIYDTDIDRCELAVKAQGGDEGRGTGGGLLCRHERVRQPPYPVPPPSVPPPSVPPPSVPPPSVPPPSVPPPSKGEQAVPASGSGRALPNPRGSPVTAALLSAGGLAIVALNFGRLITGLYALGLLSRLKSHLITGLYALGLLLGTGEQAVPASGSRRALPHARRAPLPALLLSAGGLTIPALNFGWLIMGLACCSEPVNKPFLPVAAGELSPTLAALLCLLLSAAGLAIVALNFGRLITGLYALGLLLGTVYSVPPLRLKQYPLPAFLIIATVRGFLLNFGVYYATRAALGLPFAWSPSIVFITCFVTLFATVIAITKDLPDIEGDRQFKIETFATRLGVRNIAFLGSGLLIANYCGAVAAALLLPHVSTTGHCHAWVLLGVAGCGWAWAFRQAVMIPAHLLLAAALVYQTWKLDAAAYTKDAIARFYQFIWNLFYLEYCLLPII
ncbi:unnamed protein product [Closterium sp. NIES-65]|nr:unnamed protein product [Closterium sp. NIES-65]